MFFKSTSGDGPSGPYYLLSVDGGEPIRLENSLELAKFLHTRIRDYDIFESDEIIVPIENLRGWIQQIFAKEALTSATK